MRHLLLISCRFPPLAGAGTQRALKLCKAAPELGWRVTVLAATPRPGDRCDETLLQQLPKHVPVVRTPPVPLNFLPRQVDPWLIPDTLVAWYLMAVRAARGVLDTDPVDAILSTSPPHTAHLVARTVATERQIPWMADLRDPWTDNRFLHQQPIQNPLEKLRNWLDHQLEAQVYADASLVSVTTAPLARLLQQKHGLAQEKIVLARNGFDESDFAPFPLTPPPRNPEAMLVRFAGSIYANYTFEPFLRAMEVLLQRRPQAPIRFECYLNERALAAELLARYPQTQARSSVHPQVPNNQVAALYRGADVLTLSCLDDLSTPTKVFEYARAAVPILAFTVPLAEANEVIARTQTGLCVPHDQPEVGAMALETLLDRWENHQPLANLLPEQVHGLERRVAYREMLGRLDLLCQQK